MCDQCYAVPRCVCQMKTVLSSTGEHSVMGFAIVKQCKIACKTARINWPLSPRLSQRWIALIHSQYFSPQSRCLQPYPTRLDFIPALLWFSVCLTALRSLLFLDLLQAAQKRVDLHLDLSQFTFNSLELIGLHCKRKCIEHSHELRSEEITAHPCSSFYHHR